MYLWHSVRKGKSSKRVTRVGLQPETLAGRLLVKTLEQDQKRSWLRQNQGDLHEPGFREARDVERCQAGAAAHLLHFISPFFGHLLIGHRIDWNVKASQERQHPKGTCSPRRCS
eukprot:444452-Pelagomonas_calceolata.AAC.3